MKLEDRGVRTPAHIDWLGNVTFAVGLILILVGITYGLLPYGGHTMGWTSPDVHGGDLRRRGHPHRRSASSRRRSREPMFRLTLFRIRAFTAGNVASFLASLSRGGLMFMLIIWLQGIWLPLHGYSFAADAAVGRHLHDPAHRRPAPGRARSAACWPTATAPAPSPPAGSCSSLLTFIR